MANSTKTPPASPLKDPDQGPAPGPVRRIVKNAGALLGGKAMGGVLSLFYLAIAARSLGAEGMGYLVLASAYAVTAAGIARFQSWQAVIRFGAPMAAAGDDAALGRLLRFTVTLDLASAVVGVVLSLAFVETAFRLFGWPDAARPLIYAYCFAVPFLIAATPTGVLRLFDRFKALGWQLAVMPLTRLVGALIVWAADGGLTGFLIVWIVSAFLDGASLWWLGWREVAARGLVAPILHAPRRPAPGWLGFTVKTNFASTFDLARQNVPVLIVGAVLGAAASSFVQIATNLTNLIAHPVNMLSHATYPELSRVAAQSGAAGMRAVAARSLAVGLGAAAPIVVIYCLFGGPIVTAFAGPQFAAAAPVVALMAVAQLFRTGWIVAEAAVLALGHAGLTLAAQGVSAVAQLALLFLLMPVWGAIAAPAALIAGFAMMIAAYGVRLFAAPARDKQKVVAHE